jgi:hypothetical protein
MHAVNKSRFIANPRFALTMRHRSGRVTGPRR